MEYSTKVRILHRNKYEQEAITIFMIISVSCLEEDRALLLFLFSFASPFEATQFVSIFKKNTYCVLEKNIKYKYRSNR